MVALGARVTTRGALKEDSNDPGGSRTRDLRIKSPLLYQLSYRVGDGTKFTCWNQIDNSRGDGTRFLLEPS